MADQDELGRRLLNLKKDLDKWKTKRSELQGQLNNYMEQLQEFDLNSVEEAEEKLNNLEDTIGKLQSKLNKKLQQAEEAFDE
jgi:chromosome segregation ATPase